MKYIQHTFHCSFVVVIQVVNFQPAELAEFNANMVSVDWYLTFFSNFSAIYDVYKIDYECE